MADYKEEEGIEFVKCDVRDFSKLNIVDGVIHYRIYAQDGSMIPMTIADTFSNRLFVSWIQIHDRYTKAPKG